MLRDDDKGWTLPKRKPVTKDMLDRAILAEEEAASQDPRPCCQFRLGGGDERPVHWARSHRLWSPKSKGLLPTVDARLLQIASLGTLLAIQITSFDLGADVWQATTTIVCTLLAQAIFSRINGIAFDWRSPLITGLSLSLLLRSHSMAIWASAGVIAVASKFLIRINRKHVFNPACFAIVALLVTSDQVWLSPGLWGKAIWLGFLLTSLACLVLGSAHRLDISLAFFVSYGGLLVARCLWLGDPLTIPLHQMQSGSLLLFGFFMITDPRSTPDDRIARFAFAAAVAGVAYEIQFGWQVRVGIFYALALVSPLVPFLDLWRKSTRFQWQSLQETTS